MNTSAEVIEVLRNNQPKNATETIAMVETLCKLGYLTPPSEQRKECEINGKRLSFDFTSDGDLESLIEFYDNAVYIGSGFRAWYNGVEAEWVQLHHYFKLRINEPQPDKTPSE